MVLDEIAVKDAISYATISAVISSPIPHRVLEHWWLQLAQKSPISARYSIAVAATMLLDKVDVGRQAIEQCLRADGGLDVRQKQMLGGRFADLTSEDAILWAHDQLVSAVKSGYVYKLFLSRHLATITKHRYQEMASYLLNPKLGPGDSVASCFLHICSNMENCEAFVERWQEWIYGGCFDGEDGKDNEVPEALYYLLSSAIDRKVAHAPCLVETALHRTFLLLTSMHRDQVRIALEHLKAMVTTRFKGTASAFPELDEIEIRERSFGAESDLFWRLRVLLREVVQLENARDREQLERHLRVSLDNLPSLQKPSE